jgi:bacteriocin-like protein
MGDQEQKQETNISPQLDAEKKKTELSEEELKKVTGGALHNGTHIPKVIIE